MGVFFLHYYKKGTLVPVSPADGHAVWKACDSWLYEIRSFGDWATSTLVAIAFGAWTSALAGVLFVLAMKRTIWRETFFGMHEQVVARVMYVKDFFIPPKREIQIGAGNAFSKHKLC